jgi:hypothetical protein
MPIASPGTFQITVAIQRRLTTARWELTKAAKVRELMNTAVDEPELSSVPGSLWSSKCDLYELRSVCLRHESALETPQLHPPAAYRHSRSE